MNLRLFVNHYLVRLKTAQSGTIEDCSKRTGYSQSHIRAVERGSCAVTDKYVITICKAVMYDDCVRLKMLIDQIIKIKGVYND